MSYYNELSRRHLDEFYLKVVAAERRAIVDWLLMDISIDLYEKVYEGVRDVARRPMIQTLRERITRKGKLTYVVEDTET